MPEDHEWPPVFGGRPKRREDLPKPGWPAFQPEDTVRFKLDVGRVDELRFQAQTLERVGHRGPSTAQVRLHPRNVDPPAGKGGGERDR